MFLDSCKNVAKKYSGIELDTMIVDNTCMQVGCGMTCMPPCSVQYNFIQYETFSV